MNKALRNFLTHPLMKLAYAVMILCICYFGYMKAFREISVIYDKLTKITISDFDSKKYSDRISTFGEQELEVVYPIGVKENITKEDAAAIAEQSVKALWRRNPKTFKPYSYYFDSQANLFMLVGSDPLRLESGEAPGHPCVIVRKSDGKVLALWMSEETR